LKADDIIQDWLNDTKGALIVNYDKLGLRASGRWANSLDTFIEKKQNNFAAGILGEHYTQYLENGRLPTTKGTIPGKLRGIIKNWIKVKGIVPRDNISIDSLAYLITRKIHKFGIKVPNAFNTGGLLSNVITNDKIKQLMDKLGSYYLNEIKTEMINTLK
jgi:hypothetical protein